MYRRRFRSRRAVARPGRWAREATVVDLSKVSIAASGGVGNVIVVPPTTVQGNRRISTVSLRLVWTAGVPVAYVLAYIPAGTTPSPPGSGGFASIDEHGQIPEGQSLSSLYEPNQNVLTSGVIAPNAGQITSIAWTGTRVLGSGDCIAVVFKNYFSDAVSANAGILMCSYSVAY